MATATHHWISDNKRMSFSSKRAPFKWWVWPLRVSFSEIEVMLAKTLTRQKRQCYLVAKYLIKGLEKCVISSYHIKTVFFWLLENDEFPSHMSLGEGVLLIIKDLSKSLVGTYSHWWVFDASRWTKTCVISTSSFFYQLSTDQTRFKKNNRHIRRRLYFWQTSISSPHIQICKNQT